MKIFKFTFNGQYLGGVAIVAAADEFQAQEEFRAACIAHKITPNGASVGEIMTNPPCTLYFDDGDY